VFETRTVIVLAALLAALSATSALLLLLEPGPVVDQEAVRLFSVERPSAAPEPPASERRAWRAISVRLSEEATLARAGHAGEGDAVAGSGYHFVIGPAPAGNGAWVSATPNWHRQRPADRAGEQAIAIGIVGTLERGAARERALVRLVQKLQARFDIEPEAIEVDAGDAEVLPERFPLARFRSQLLYPSRG